MRLEIGVLDKLARADPCAINDEVEFSIDIFEFPEADVRVDFSGSLTKPHREIIEINRRVRERDAQGKAACERFERSLDFARDDKVTK